LVTAATLDLLTPGGDPVDAGAAHPLRAVPAIQYAAGLRRPEAAALEVLDADGTASRIELAPLLTFRMRGVGYLHPTYAHGHYHGDLVVDGEAHEAADLDTTSLHDLHVEQVVEARWEGRRGLGVLELLPIGPHARSGLVGLNDGAG